MKNAPIRNSTLNYQVGQYVEFDFQRVAFYCASRETNEKKIAEKVNRFINNCGVRLGVRYRIIKIDPDIVTIIKDNGKQDCFHIDYLKPQSFSCASDSVFPEELFKI